MRQVYTTKRAEISYYKILDYLQENWGNTEHKNVEDQVQKVLSTIATQPYVYPAIEKNRHIRRAVVLNIISIYYKVYNDKIEVVLFWDNRRNPDDLTI